MPVARQLRRVGRSSCRHPPHLGQAPFVAACPPFSAGGGCQGGTSRRWRSARIALEGSASTGRTIQVAGGGLSTWSSYGARRPDAARSGLLGHPPRCSRQAHEYLGVPKSRLIDHLSSALAPILLADAMSFGAQ